MKFSAALALLPLAAAMPTPNRAENMLISIRVNIHGQPQKPHNALYLDREYPVCDKNCPDNVFQSTTWVLHMILTTLVAMCRNLRLESEP